MEEQEIIVPELVLTKEQKQQHRERMRLLGKKGSIKRWKEQGTDEERKRMGRKMLEGRIAKGLASPDSLNK